MKKLGVRMIHIDFHPLLGGAQAHSLRLSRYLQSQGVDVEVITRHYPGLPYDEEIEGVPVHRMPIYNRSKIGASLSFTANALIRLSRERNRYQVIHSHEMLSPMTVGLFGQALTGAKLVVNPHSGGYLGDVYKLQRKRKITGGMRLAWARRGGDAFISISKQIHNELRSVGIPEERIFHIPCAIETGHYHPVAEAQRLALRSKLGLPGGLLACYTGRLAEEKGLDVLLQAWAQVSTQFDDAHLLIVGDGSLRSQLEALAQQLKLNGSVRFTGTVADTAPYLQASDLYVQPSFREGLPLAMLEAMSCELAVLATNVGGISDLMVDHHNGLLAPSHDADQLAEGLREVASRPDLRRTLGEQARRDVSGYCDLQKIGEAHLELYHRLVGW